MKKYLIFIIALFHSLATFFTDRYIFDFNNINIFNYVVCKILMIFVLILFWYNINKYIKKENQLRMYAKHFLAYFIPMGLLLLITWPGFWYGSDVYNFFSVNKTADFLYYLSYFTSVFNIVSYMIFPVPSAPIIMQIILMSITMSYILTNAYYMFNKHKLTYILLIPFFLPIIIIYTLYPNRPIIYGILYLLLISFLFFDFYNKKELSLKKLTIILFLTAILSTFRSEGIYLVLFVPILLSIVYRKKVKTFVIYLCLTILLTFILSIPQNMDNNKKSKLEQLKRNLPSVVNPLAYLVTQNLNGDNIEEDLINIDKVLDVNKMKKYPSLLESLAVWEDGGCIKDFTVEEYNLFAKSYVDIIINNPILYLKSKTYTFYHSSGLTNRGFTSYNLFNGNYELIDGYLFTKPINYKLRSGVLKILEGVKNNNDKYYVYRVFNNLIIPLIFIGLSFIKSLFSKNIFLLTLTTMLIGHTLLVFIVAPANYFMYYYPIYLTGNFLIAVFLIDYILKKRKLQN